MRFKIITTTEIEFEKGVVNIISKDTQIVKNEENCKIIESIHRLNRSEPQYGIICFTKRDQGDIYKFLPRDTNIIVKHKDDIYYAHTHQTIDGRIGRLSKFYRKYGDKFHEDAQIIAEYNIEEKSLTIL